MTPAQTLHYLLMSTSFVRVALTHKIAKRKRRKSEQGTAAMLESSETTQEGIE